MSDIVEELERSKTKDGFKIDSEILSYLAIFFVVVLFAVYVGNILFGKNSLEVYLKLQNQKESLSTRVEELKESNALLQKEYFELKELEP